MKNSLQSQKHNQILRLLLSVVLLALVIIFANALGNIVTSLYNEFMEGICQVLPNC